MTGSGVLGGRAEEDFPPLASFDPGTAVPPVGTFVRVDPRLLSLVELFIAPLGVAALLFLVLWGIERLLRGRDLRN